MQLDSVIAVVMSRPAGSLIGVEGLDLSAHQFLSCHTAGNLEDVWYGLPRRRQEALLNVVPWCSTLHKHVPTVQRTQFMS